MLVSRRFQFWGEATHEIYFRWLTPFLVLSLLFMHGGVVSGVPLANEDAGTILEEGEPKPVNIPSHHQSQLHQVRTLNQNMKQIMTGMGEAEVGAPIQQQDVEISLPKLKVLGLLLEKYKQRDREAAEEDAPEEVLEQEQPEADIVSVHQVSRGSGSGQLARALWTQDYERRASELCGTSASLQCGQRILELIEGQEKELDIHRKCDLRDDFLMCIDTQKKDCLELAESSILPQLPPKEMIRAERSKLWKVLWAAGGCVLAN